MNISIEVIKKWILCFLYTICLVAGLIFSKNTIIEFMSGKTAFHTAFEPIRLEDWPTIALCYDKRTYKSTAPPIISGEMVHGDSNTTLEMTITDVLMGKFEKGINCWKIVLIEKLNERQIIPNGALQLTINVQLPAKALQMDFNMHITSKENFYGIGNNNWFDGRVGELTFKSGYNHRIRIIEMIETNFIKDCTSRDSYYGTVAKKFVLEDWVSKNLSYRGKSDSVKRRCEFTNFCLPLTLPLDWPLCNTSTEELFELKQKCYFVAFQMTEAALKKSMAGDLRSCKIKEYTPEISMSYKQTRHLKLVVSFRASSRNIRWSNTIQKTVKEEYYIMDFITFVGLIGGTLGLFVGLSFMDISSCLIEIVDKTILCVLKHKRESLS